MADTNVVRALYHYESEDGTMRFSPGDIIQVFTQLESGWWDGLCNNVRGWFPSNYVAPTLVMERRQVLDRIGKVLSKFSLSDEEMDVGNVFREEEDVLVLPQAWELRQGNDERIAYMHREMQNVKWVLPEGAAEVGREDVWEGLVEEARKRREDRREAGKEEPQGDGESGSQSENQPRNETMSKGDQPLQAGRNGLPGTPRTSTPSALHEAPIQPESPNSQRTSSCSSPQAVGPDSHIDPDPDLPIRDSCTPPDQRLSEADSTEPPKELRTDPEMSRPDDLPIHTPQAQPPQSISTGTIRQRKQSLEQSNASPKPPPLTPWQTLLQPVFLSLQNLDRAARQPQSYTFIPHSSDVVESVRRLLTSSGLKRRDSEVFIGNEKLRQAHKALLKALSRLVVTARKASRGPTMVAPAMAGATASPPVTVLAEEAKNLIGQGTKLLDALKAFSKLAQEADLAISGEGVEEAQKHMSKLQSVSKPTTNRALRYRSKAPRAAITTATGRVSRGSSRHETRQRSIAAPRAHHGSPVTQAFPSRSKEETFDENSHILSRLDRTSKSMRSRMAEVMTNINAAVPPTAHIDSRDSSDGYLGINASSVMSASDLVSQTRMTVTEVADFLHIVEDIRTDMFSRMSDVLQDFKSDILALYNNISGLVMATQKATEPLAPVESLFQLVVALKVVDRSIVQLTSSVRVLLDERAKLGSLHAIKNNQAQQVHSQHSPVSQATPPQEEFNNRRGSPDGRATLGGDTGRTRADSGSARPANTDSGMPGPEAVDSVQDNGPDQLHEVQAPSTSPSSTEEAKTVDRGQPPEQADLPPVCVDSRGTSEDIPEDGEGFTMLPPPVHRPSIPPNFAPGSTTEIPESPTEPSTVKARARSAPGIDTSPQLSSAPTLTSANKLKKFFGVGDDSAIKDFQRMRRDESPWFLGQDHPHADLVFNMEGMVKGGTKQALIGRLTRHDRLDQDFVQFFLLTYREFMTSSELMDGLFSRFSMSAPPGLTDEEMDVWVEKKRTPVRYRVCNVLKQWVEIYSVRDISEDLECFEKLRQFSRESLREAMPAYGVQLIKLVDKRESGELRNPTGRKVSITSSVNAGACLSAAGPPLDTGELAPALSGGGPPTPANNANTPSVHTSLPPPVISAPVRKPPKRLRTLDMDAMEVARQLSLIESQLYSQIHFMECLDKAWSTAEKSGEKTPPVYPLPPLDENLDPTKAVNIRRMIAMSNRVTSWVAQSILEEDDLRKRAALTKHFISIADKCRQLNNFNTLMSILAGLDSAPIHRLGRTWAMLANRTHMVLNNLKRITHPTKNFSEYREELHNAKPPCVPFLGVYLTDLTFIAEGNPDYLRTPSSVSEKRLINFSKHAKTAEVIRDIQQFQSVPYPLRPVPEIQDFLLRSISASRDANELYEMSLEREPREREDEKLVRLLHESGLL